MNKSEIKKGMKMARMVGDALADAKFATKNEVDALSDTYVTFSAMSSALSTVKGGGADIDTDSFVTNASLSATINSLSNTYVTNTALSTAIYYVGTTKPADFHGIFFKTI